MRDFARFCEICDSRRGSARLGETRRDSARFCEIRRDSVGLADSGRDSTAAAEIRPRFAEIRRARPHQGLLLHFFSRPRVSGILVSSTAFLPPCRSAPRSAADPRVRASEIAISRAPPSGLRHGARRGGRRPPDRATRRAGWRRCAGSSRRDSRDLPRFARDSPEIVPGRDSPRWRCPVSKTRGEEQSGSEHRRAVWVMMRGRR